MNEAYSLFVYEAAGSALNEDNPVAASYCPSSPMNDAVVHLAEVGVGGDDDSGDSHCGSVEFTFSVGVAVTVMWKPTVW